MNNILVWISAAIVLLYIAAVVIAFRRRFPPSRKQEYCPDWADAEFWEESEQ